MLSDAASSCHGSSPTCFRPFEIHVSNVQAADRVVTAYYLKAPQLTILKTLL